VGSVVCPAESIDLATVPLRRSTGAGIANQWRGDEVSGWKRRAVVDECLGRKRRTHTLVEQFHDLEGPVSLCHSDLDPCTHGHLCRRLGRGAIDRDVSARARCRGSGARLVHADCP